MSLSHISVPFFKSPSRVVTSFLFRSREKTRAKVKKLQKQLEDLERQHQRVVNQKRELENRCAQQQRELHQTKQEVAKLSAGPVCLPPDFKLDRHRFGVRLIAMCCNLAKTVGFRAAESVLEIVRQWLGTDFKIPSWSIIRTWLCRSGVAALTEAAVRHDDWILMIDHSVQLGETSVLIVLGIRQSDLPVGRALQHEDMKTLAVIPAPVHLVPKRLSGPH